MKNRIKFLGALALLACGFVFTGCGDVADATAEDLGIVDKWFEYDYEYTSGDSTVTLECFLIYETEETEVGTKTKITVPAGLSMLIVPEQSSNSSIVSELIGAITDSQYILYKIPNGGSTDLSDDSSGSSSSVLKMNSTTWIAIYEYLRTKDEFDTSGDTPWILAKKNATEFNISNLKETFSLKGILRAILLSYL